MRTLNPSQRMWTWYVILKSNLAIFIKFSFKLMSSNFTSSNLSYRNTRTQGLKLKALMLEDISSLIFRHIFSILNVYIKAQISTAPGVRIQWLRRQAKYGPKILYSNNKLAMRNVYPSIILYRGSMLGICK